MEVTARNFSDRYFPFYLLLYYLRRLKIHRTLDNIDQADLEGFRMDKILDDNEPSRSSNSGSDCEGRNEGDMDLGRHVSLDWNWKIGSSHSPLYLESRIIE